MDQTDENELLDDLLTTWEDRVARGENPSAEELCIDYPELFGEVHRHIKALQSFASRFGFDDEKNSAALQDDATSTDLPVQTIRIEAEYQLERLHAVGGLGSVYLAHDPQLNRRVAIKFPRGKRHAGFAVRGGRAEGNQPDFAPLACAAMREKKAETNLVACISVRRRMRGGRDGFRRSGR